MVIEVTKKSLLRLGVILFVFVMFMLCGYVAYTQGYIRGYESGVADTTHKYENPKGNGNNFFAEEINPHCKG